MGTAAVFAHSLWHDGEPVTSGTKHVMRTDVFYEAVAPSALDHGAGRGVLRGHEGYVFVVRALSDGSLVSGSRDRTIRRWRLGASGSWACDEVLEGHEASVLALEELADGALVSGSRDRTVRVWRRREGASTSSELLATFGGAVLALARIDDETLACGAADGCISLLDLRGRVVREAKGHRERITAENPVPVQALPPHPGCTRRRPYGRPSAQPPA